MSWARAGLIRYQLGELLVRTNTTKLVVAVAMVASKVCITGCQTVEWLTKHMVVSDILVGQNALLSRGPRNEFHNSPAVIFCEGGQLELAKLRASITVKHTLTSLGCTQHEAQIWIWSWISAASKNSLPATATVCYGRQLARGRPVCLPGWQTLTAGLYSTQSSFGSREMK